MRLTAHRGNCHGVPLAESHDRDQPFPGERTDTFTLSGWLQHSYVIVERAQIFSDDPAQEDHLETCADSIGYTTRSNPVAGSATWEDVMSGYGLGTATGALIEGDATITMEPAARPFRRALARHNLDRTAGG